MSNLNEYDWYCDECNAYLNSQEGFDADCGSWTCTECGYENDIDEFELIDEDELQDFKDSGCSSLNEYRYGFDYDDDEEDEPGEGCVACGNPAYPDCKSSCPLFDD